MWLRTRWGACVSLRAYQRVSLVVAIPDKTNDALTLCERRASNVQARVAARGGRDSQLQLSCRRRLVVREHQH